MKAVFVVFLILLDTLSAQVSSHPIPVPLVTPVESKAKEIGGLEFSVVTLSEWAVIPHSQRNDMIVQLRISNPGTKDMVFPTFDSFHARLTFPDGKVVPLATDRDATLITPNILLKPGTTYSYQLIATLEYKQEKQQVVLHFQDHTGSGSRTIMPVGNYSLDISLLPCQYGTDEIKKLPVTLWAAEGTTESLPFKLLPIERSVD